MAKRITKDAILTALALVIFVVEAQIPPLAPIPGIKLGLANIVTVWALMAIGPTDAFGILICRIILGGIFTGRLPSLIFSLAGGLLSFAVVLLVKKLLTERQIWVAGVIGAVFHNAGQLAAAVIVYRTTAVLVYTPVLILSGIVTGLFTGICAQLLTGRLGHLVKKDGGS